MFKKLFFIFLLLTGFTISSQAQADGPNIQTFKPNANYGGLFSLQGSETLPDQQTFEFGLSFNYSDTPLETANVGISDSLTTLDFTASTRLVRGLDFWFNAAYTLSQEPSGTFASVLSSDGLNDFSAGFKWQVVNLKKHKVGLALSPFLVMPVGDEDNLLGESGVGYGIDAIVDTQIKRLYLAMSLGYHGRENENVLANLSVKNEIKYGLGLGVDLVPNSLEALAEVNGRLDVDETLSFSNKTSPVEVLAGLRKHVSNNFDVAFGGGRGLNSGYGAPNWRGFFMMKWRPRFADAPANTLQGLSLDSLPHVHFETGSSELNLDSYFVLDKIAETLQKNPEIRTLVIKGHTDATGPRDVNEILAEERAAAVKNYLQIRGIAPNRLKTENHANQFPIDDAMNSRFNRRVDFQAHR